MSTVTDDIEFDEDEDEASPATPQRNARTVTAGLLARWKAWPKWARWLSIPVAAYVAIVGVGLVLGMLAALLGLGGGDDDQRASAPATSTTAPPTSDALKGLPAIAPIVAAVVRPEDRSELHNLVLAATADGSSICDVYFGVIVEERTDGTMATRWEVTTPALQHRSGVGVQLPSATWPVRAIYGGRCDVAGQDVPLPTTVPSTTTTAVSPGE